MNKPTAREFYTVFIAGIGKSTVKHIKIPAKLIDNYKKYVLAGSISVISMLIIGILLLSNYQNALSRNIEYAQEIERLRQENELLDADKLAEKFAVIENKVGDINDYLDKRGFINKDAVKESQVPNDVINASNNNKIKKNEVKKTTSSVEQKLKNKELSFSLVENYFQSLTNLSETIKTVPLGFPYNGKKTSGFGPRGNPFNGKGRETHKGVDMKGPVGDKIKTTADGKVIKAGRHGGYGNAVIVQHEHGLSTLYGHMSKVNVKEGQTVKAGDVVGLLGSTGRSTGPHLHYEVRLNNKQINPESFLKLNK